MNAILFYVTNTFRLTGSTINAIEYFLAAYEHNKDLKLILINGNSSFQNKIFGLMKKRYILDGLNGFRNNIECIRKASLPVHKFDTVLVLDYVTIFKTKGLINAKKILVISEKYTDNSDYFYRKSLYNVEYYGEMPFHYKDHEYRMKCLFDRYKSIGTAKKGTYINSPRNTKLNVEYFASKYEFPSPYIIKSKTKPEKNLFEKFTHYFYYHADKWFDPHPRLFLECVFYDKDIIYVNPNNIKDGSWYRYQDILKNKLHGRTLDYKDEIIDRLI